MLDVVFWDLCWSCAFPFTLSPHEMNACIVKDAVFKNLTATTRRREKRQKHFLWLKRSFSSYFFHCSEAFIRGCQWNNSIPHLDLPTYFTSSQFFFLVVFFFFYTQSKSGSFHPSHLPSLSSLARHLHWSNFIHKELEKASWKGLAWQPRTENKLGVHNFKRSLTKATPSLLPKVCLAWS